MPNYLRFQLFTDETRSNYAPLDGDISVDVLPMYSYGESVELGDFNNPTYYRVANVSHIIRETSTLGMANVIYEVYLIRAEDWDGNNPLFEPNIMFRDVV